MKTEFEQLIERIARKHKVVSFSVHDNMVEISAQPTTTGMGSSITIPVKANWCDALKAIDIKLS